MAVPFGTCRISELNSFLSRTLNMLDGYDDESTTPSPRETTPDDYYQKLLSGPSPRAKSPALDIDALITGDLPTPLESSRHGDDMEHPFPRYSAEPDDSKNGILDVPTQILRSLMRKRKPSGIFCYLVMLILCLFTNFRQHQQFF